MSLVHSSFGWRNLATNCYPLRSSQGVGAEWHDGEPSRSQFRAPSPLSCALPSCLLRGWMLCARPALIHVARPDAGNIERELALSVLVSLSSQEMWDCKFSPSCCAVGSSFTTRRSPKVYRTAPLLRPRRPGFMQTKGLGRPWLRCGLAGWRAG